jgi:hypothetical protein
MGLIEGTGTWTDVNTHTHTHTHTFAHTHRKVNAPHKRRFELILDPI